jgi:predicted secreted protein
VDLPAEVTLRAGEEQTLRLPSLAGGGYRWVATADDESVVEVHARFDDAVTTASGASAFSPDELLTLRGRRVGTAQVRCIQQRGWEQDAVPIADHNLRVTVVAADEKTTERGDH